MSDPYDRLQHELVVLARRADALGLEPSRVAGSTLDRSGFLILGHLDDIGGMSAVELADAFDLDPSTVSQQITPLERSGFVVRERSRIDARTTIVAITDAGRLERARVRRARSIRTREVLGGWNVADTTHLAHMLGRLNTTLTDTPFAAT